MAEKVLHIITGLGDGGAEGVLTRVCINSKRYDHVVISLSTRGKYGDILEKNGIRVYALDMSPGKPSAIKFYRLFKWIRKEKPEIVQTWMYHADIFGGLAAKLARVKHIFWGVRQAKLEKGVINDSTINIAKICGFLSCCIPSKIICCAESARDFHASIGYDERKLIVIHNGYDVSNFKSCPVWRHEIRDEFGVGENKILLGMIGRYAVQKDHATLLKALSLAVMSNSSLSCLLVGRGLTYENKDLIDLIERLRLKENVILAGQRPDIPKIMNALDIHCLSSTTEGFPNVLAEAMACGTPVVSTNVGDAALIVGNTGLICEARSPEALCDNILSLVEEMKEKPLSWQLRKSKAQSRIVQSFSLDGSIKSFESVWSGLV